MSEIMISDIKEAVLKLPREGKLDILQALREDLDLDDDYLDEDELSPEDWAEIKRREDMIESGEAKWLSTEEFESFLKERRNALHGNKD